MTRLIDADILKDAINTWDKFACLPNGELEPFRNLEHPEMFEPYIHFRDVIKAIDNAPTVPLPDFKEGYKQAIRDGKTNFSSPQGKWDVISLLRDYVYIRCSECGQGTRLVRDSKNEFCCIKDIRDKIVACPYCGAKMFKEKVKENELQSL